MSKFTIPTVFKAVDQFSGPVQRMANNMDKFEKSAGGLVGTFGDIQRELFSFVSKMAVIGAIGGVFTLGINSIMDYETALHSLEAVTGQASSLYKKQIETIATNTRKSAIDVTKSFEIIGSAMSEYLDNPKALGQISEAGITLAKASRMELEPALGALTSVMNQFGLSADMATDTINRLTAGEIVGSISTQKVSDHLQEFGAVAAANNVTLSESVALVETLGKKLPVETLGRASRNMITFMGAVKGMPKQAQEQLAKYGVNLDIVSNKALPYAQRLKELSKIQNDAIAMEAFFGRENIAAGTAIFQQLGTYDEYVKKIQNTNEAAKQAAVNSNTLANAMLEVKNSFINAVVSGDKLSPSLEVLKSLAFLLAKNMDTVVSVVGIAIGAFVAWKAATLGVTAVMMANEAFLSGKFIVAMIKQVALTNGTTFATAALAVAQSSLNAAMLANPIGVVVAGLIALTAAGYGLYKMFSKGTAQEQAAEALRERAIENTAAQRAEVSALFGVLKKAEEGSKLYNDTLKKLEQMQPGIIDKYGLQVKSIERISAAEKDLMNIIMQRAQLQASAEITKESAKELAMSQMNAKQYESGWKQYMYISKWLANQDVQDKQAAFEAASSQEVALNKEAEVSATMNGNINLNVNDPNNRATVSATPGINIKQPTTTSTTGF